MKKDWVSTKGAVNKKRQDYLDTGFTVCKKHGYHSRWLEQTIKGCPCIYCRDCINDNKRKRTKANPIKAKFNWARDRASKFKREFTIDLDYVKFLLEKQNNKCALSNIPFEDYGQFSFSIDRIDSSKGYSKDNTQLVCQVINTMKMDSPQDLFISICTQIHNANTMKD